MPGTLRALQDEDQTVLGGFPEWTGYIAHPVTHSDTYKAGHEGHVVLENLIATAQNEGVSLPRSTVHVA